MKEITNSFNLSVAPRKPRFSGGFKTTTIVFSTDHESGVVGKLVVYSKGARLTVFKYLWLKFLWDQLTRQEYLLLISFPEAINNEKVYNYFRVINQIPKKIARRNLLRAERFLGLEESSRERYQGIKGLVVEIHYRLDSLPKPPKFSGYVKTPSSVGSKSRGGSSFLETTTDPDEIMKSLLEPMNWFQLLTVGTDSLPFEDLISSDEL